MSAPVELLPPGPASIRLRLADPAYLFVGPVSDPLNGVPDGFSGLDQVRLALKRDWRGRDRIKMLELQLPPIHATADMAARLEAAIDAHVAVERADAEANHLLHGRHRNRAWVVGVAFLAACLMGSVLADRLLPADNFAATLVRESLVIAGWVGLWRALDLTLYEWWPIRFQKEMLAAIAGLKVRITAA